MKTKNTTNIRVSLEAYKQLSRRKKKTGVPITTQIDQWLKVKK